MALDFKQLPFIKDIDFSDPAKRKNSIRICAGGAILFLLLIMLIIKAPWKKEEKVQTVQEYNSVEIPMGEDQDQLSGKTIRDVGQKRHNRAGAFAENLFSEEVAERDPLAALNGEKAEDTDVLNEGDKNLPSFMRGENGNKDVYPEKKKEAASAKSGSTKKPSAAATTQTTGGPQSRQSVQDELTSGAYPDAESKRRRLYEMYGLDPETGQPLPDSPIANGAPTKTSSAATATSTTSNTTTQENNNSSSSTATTTNQQEDASDVPPIETVKVQVRRSGGVSSFGSSGTELSNLGEQDEFVTDDPSHPFKVKFAYDEKVTSGKRVTIRLCEDMLVDGVLIPVNTHLFATCSVGERLKLDVNSIDINGKIYTLNYTAYDNDGAEGLYCPQSKSSKIAKEAVEQAGQIAQTAVQAAITGYASRIFQSGASIVKSTNGTPTVSVTAGYTFYLVKSKQ